MDKAWQAIPASCIILFSERDKIRSSLILSLPLDDGHTLDVRIRTSSRAKRLRLVSSLQGVEAVAPVNYNMAELQEFIKSKKGWISKTSDYYGKIRQKAGHIESERDILYYLGKKFQFKVVKDRLHFTTVSENLRTITFHVGDRRRYKHHIQEWYRRQTGQIIAERLPPISQRLGLDYNKFSIKKQRSRWASCSKKKNLNFNLLLAAAPQQVIDYVIIHELAHLVVMDHSKKFWDLVATFDPDYRNHKVWLEDHAPVIGVQDL
jgi:hypothetical protein